MSLSIQSLLESFSGFLLLVFRSKQPTGQAFNVILIYLGGVEMITNFVLSILLVSCIYLYS